MINRRGFLRSLLNAAVAAPAIVSFANIMPVKALVLPTDPEWDLIVREFIDDGLPRHEFLDKADWRQVAKEKGGTIKTLNSIARPWERPDYGLREDLLAAFKEHGIG